MEHPVDIRVVERDRARRFFLQNILKARIALKLETGCHGDDDQQANMYIAGLFDALVGPEEGAQTKPYVSPFDADIVRYLEGHPGTRTEYVVYKENADFGLMAVGVFMGYHHPGSYYQKVLAPTDDSPRIAFYYRCASSALEHLRGPHHGLVHTLGTIADHVYDFVKIIRKVAGDYFDFIEHISDGSFYHLERELQTVAIRESYERKMDEFLRLYSQYRENPSIEAKDALIRCAAELKIMNPGFAFDKDAL